MITLQKIKIYEECGGDEDGLSRGLHTGKGSLFDKDDWYILTNIYQDIEMIKNKVASSEYSGKANSYIQKHCNEESVSYFMNKF